jgi:hypothetical protein
MQDAPAWRGVVGLERVDAVQAQLGAAVRVDAHRVRAGNELPGAGIVRDEADRVAAG